MRKLQLKWRFHHPSHNNSTPVIHLHWPMSIARHVAWRLPRCGTCHNYSLTIFSLRLFFEWRHIFGTHRQVALFVLVTACSVCNHNECRSTCFILMCCLVKRMAWLALAFCTQRYSLSWLGSQEVAVEQICNCTIACEKTNEYRRTSNY